MKKYLFYMAVAGVLMMLVGLGIGTAQLFGFDHELAMHIAWSWFGLGFLFFMSGVMGM